MKNGYFLCIKTSNKRINSIEKERMEYLYNSCICMKDSGIWISSILFCGFDKKDGSWLSYTRMSVNEWISWWLVSIVYWIQLDTIERIDWIVEIDEEVNRK